MASRVHQPLENEEFDFILGHVPGPVLAYFTGTWPKVAAVCKEMDALVREAADAYGGRLTAVKADMTRCPGPTARYGVTSAPWFVLVTAGEVVATREGPLDRAGLKEFLDAAL
ncbi:thioredoxin domain-containing protein [Streptomyces sp. NBC_00536]|uniref:thioredoxin family protein n=1 Tax=Streptomyces sp. NBC_00536 TaxID=2975769 RepID=UPI002E822536|nr:thioredoxin domain-containing protein [Streptomyces sp. NBC_00536]WUC82568.1 thioredoxin domain-containing protein [Streptomyces sp. NBC_00536]